MWRGFSGRWRHPNRQSGGFHASDSAWGCAKPHLARLGFRRRGAGPRASRQRRSPRSSRLATPSSVLRPYSCPGLPSVRIASATRSSRRSRNAIWWLTLSPDPPPALEVEVPSLRSRPGDPHRCEGNDAREQVAGVSLVAIRDRVLEPVHERRLVSGARPAQAPYAVVAEVAHVGVARDAPDRALADDVPHRRRRAVVGAPDHRAEQLAVGLVRGPGRGPIAGA